MKPGTARVADKLQLMQTSLKTILSADDNKVSQYKLSTKLILETGTAK